MRYAGLGVLTLLLPLGGCGGLTPEQQERINELTGANVRALDTIKRAAKDYDAGTLDASTFKTIVTEARELIERNERTLADIRDEGASWWAIVGGLIGAFGRSALHGLAGKAGPLGPLLGMLLGGSATKRKKDEEAG